MITPSDKAAAEQVAEEFDQWQAAVDSIPCGSEREILESALAFSNRETTREEKLYCVILAAANKIRLGDTAGALLSLETGLAI